MRQSINNSRLGRWIESPSVHPYWRLTRMDRPIGSLVILWPTLTALWLAADGWPSIKNILIFTLGVFIMRSAGCAINDFADRNIDGRVQRTSHRPLATGELTVRQALITFTLLLLLALVLVSMTNILTIKLSLVGAALCAIYPFMKRFTHLPQVVLGLAMNWGVVMAYSAESGELNPDIFVFYAATIAWTVAYDTYYAMVDREDDLRIGVKSIAILFGEYDRSMIGILQILTVLGLILTGGKFELGLFWYAGVIAVALLFLWQQRITRQRDQESCFRAFMSNNLVGICFFVGVISAPLWQLAVSMGGSG